MAADVERTMQVLQQIGAKNITLYEEPFSGEKQIFALLPVSKVSAAPFQRDLSSQHVKRLAQVILKVGRYLDPIVVVPGEGEMFYTPNGNHRLEAMRSLGKDYIAAIVVPDPEVARAILSLNTEKTPNLKEKSLEVIRLYRELLKEIPEEIEFDMAFFLEEPYYATFGIIYQQDSRFSGSAYTSYVKKIDQFLSLPLKEAIKEREKRAEKIKELHQVVLEKESKFREAGINYPFLRQYIVSKANPYKRLRKVEVDFYEGIDQLIENIKALSPEHFSAEEYMAGGFE